MSSHSEASPSQLKRILLCPGSRRMVVKYQKDGRGSAAASEGTMLHDAIQRQIKKEADSREYATEQLSALHECYKYYTDLHDQYTKEGYAFSCHTEKRTSLKWAGLPETGGSVDLVFIQYKPGYGIRKMDVVDWKFGKGVPVKVENNPQIRSYGAGLVMSYSQLEQIEEIGFHIIQPRLDYFGREIITGKELITWLQEVLLPGVIASRGVNAPCIPGEEQCRWCVGLKCEAFYQQGETAINLIGDRDLHEINEKELAEILHKKSIINSFFNKVEAYAKEKLFSQEGFPGWTLKPGRSKRRWCVDEEEVAKIIPKIIGEDISVYKTEILSVPQIEKLNKKLKNDERFLELYIKESGPAVLSPSEVVTEENITAVKKKIF